MGNYSLYLKLGIDDDGDVTTIIVFIIKDDIIFRKLITYGLSQLTIFLIKGTIRSRHVIASSRNTYPTFIMGCP